ncbi:hypothetical protein N9W79_00295 [bacterium]|nr:hypothetical protein [bacterium]
MSNNNKGPKKLFDDVDASDFWDKNTHLFEAKVMAEIDAIEVKNSRRRQNLVTGLFLCAAAIFCAVYLGLQTKQISNEDALLFVYETTLEASDYGTDYEDFNF